ncbi:GTP cyclohydrolase I FolE2 [Pusillimonas sp. CC-YST705]|uniref:GTP cyclohydrolase FolE2 n=1 Tax=Mesopusillimonas faecipullorum TaxID=2755040 RepID=A0ABS8CD80_9BURK|nr:GTP cyclohydrolase FolE2 [Mesopusillimonas faecipullorum]MCB5363958.1 GTP cyclohydrolase I FolE2 [Mesopusillimonas faecipullorum]
MNTITDSVVAMPDVQSSLDTRHLPIQRVGVRSVRHPMLISGGEGQAALPTVAEWELTVALPAHEKGTHMSRFVALLDEYRPQAMTPALFCDMAEKMLPLLNAEQGDLTAVFPYFINKVAPVSGVASLMDYEVTWLARSQVGKPTEFELTVLVPVTSLCPCSKAISEYGAHNQRSHVTVQASFGSPEQVDIVTLIQRIEQQASCELWGLLKRGDEKYVTERAYDNPKFVEDLVRDVAVQVRDFPGVQQYRVEAENFESIHNHSAYAVVVGP